MTMEQISDHPVVTAFPRALLIAAMVGVLLCQLGFCWVSLARSLHGSTDFRAFYAAGHIVASGQGSHLYQSDYQQQVQSKIVGAGAQTLPFLYPAYAALLFVPLSFVPYKIAFILFGTVNLGLLCLTGRLLRRHLEFLHKFPPWFIASVFFCLFPVSIALMQGQVSFILLLLYSGCYVLLRKERPFLAGVVVAFALTKFQIALPIALLFLCWRRFRFIGGFACGALAIGAVSVAIAGPHGTLEYLTGLTSVASGTLLNANAARLKYGMFAADMPNLHGFFFVLTRGSLIGQAFSVGCSSLVMFWAWLQRPSLRVALPAAMLVSYHMQPYDLTLLILPLTVAAGYYLKDEDGRRGTCRRFEYPLRQGLAWKAAVFWVSLGILIVPVAPLLLVRGSCSLFILAVLGAMWCGTETFAS
jgi:Glycosyltransferase family 87